MQTIKKKEETKSKEQKLDYYMPNDLPNSSRAYELIKKFEEKILRMVAFTTPDLDSRQHMDSVRDNMRFVVCKHCVHLGQLKQSKLRVKVFVKDDQLSELPDKVVLNQVWKDSDKFTMACEGCRALRLKQIATGYIKGRRFKQV